MRQEPIKLVEGEKIIKEYTGISIRKTTFLSWAILVDMGVTITNKRIYFNQGRRVSSLSIVYHKNDLGLFSKLNSAQIKDLFMKKDMVCISIKGGFLPMVVTWKIKEDAGFIYETIRKYITSNYE